MADQLLVVRDWGTLFAPLGTPPGWSASSLLLVAVQRLPSLRDGESRVCRPPGSLAALHIYPAWSGPRPPSCQAWSLGRASGAAGAVPQVLA